MKKSLIIGLLSALVLAGCGGSGGGSNSSNNGIPNDRTVDLQVVVTDRIGNILQTFSEDDVAVTAANENATIASHIAAIIDDNLGSLPSNATLVVSDLADLNVNNYPELALHPEYIRYPRLTGDAPLDDPLPVLVDGDIQDLFLFGDTYNLQDGLARIIQYFTSEVLIPSGDVNRIGIGRPKAITVYIRDTGA